ncbi:MAG: TonB-dependent receptor [Tannerella sp.]|jgi:iron complex outermembrane receptor protein|nr:TonB-dependent receptor [Tannerella sp.]
MKNLLLTGLITIAGQYPALAQQSPPDTVPLSVDLQEIVISVKTGINPDRQAKPSAPVEEYLQTSEKVGMIKRGNYAWEPSINSMTTERISVTIEGMKIFHACTDRMDPVTSYVETVNLSKVSLGSGFEANPNASNNIGGSLDLRLNKTGFCNDGLDLNARTGYESNGGLWVGGADVSYAGPRFYINSGLFRRHSGNYSAGGKEEIPFSQFTKNNFFTNLGYVVANGKAIEGTLIYDRASDVGYPALAMDVATAEGLISSLSCTVENPLPLFYKWENKVYYNNIIHIMDDTKRPDVVMHMDMPGKSRTSGAYSTLNGQNGKHRYSFNWDVYYNQSYAEMTMYSNNPDEIPMFMLTWPDVRTLNTGLFAVDEYRFDDRHSVRLSAKTSFQRDGLQSDFGLNTLQAYYPGMAQYKNRITGNIAGRYQFKRNAWETTVCAGYGTRAPSVSEAYGFYLFNTFDAYDYLGNPHLRQESAVETSLSSGWKKLPLEVRAEASYFYFTNYIIGRPRADLSHMTPGASGVKVYENFPHASILNASLLLKYWFLEYFSWNGRITYARGQDDRNGNLPLIAPVSYDASLTFRNGKFSAEAGIAGAARQKHFSPAYGEDETRSYRIAGLSAGYGFKINRVIFNLKAGVENLFDTYYSTYASWRNIPRKGRNVFINLGINF